MSPPPWCLTQRNRIKTKESTYVKNGELRLNHDKNAMMYNNYRKLINLHLINIKCFWQVWLRVQSNNNFLLKSASFFLEEICTKCCRTDSLERWQWITKYVRNLKPWAGKMAQCVQVWWPKEGPQNSQEKSLRRHSTSQHSYGKMGGSYQRIIQKVVGQLA